MDPARVIELEALSLQEPMNSVIDRGDSEVQQYYKDAAVFVTGGAGFLGKQLVEKLFRSTAIRKLYLLLRPKKGVCVQDRLRAMLSDPVFDAVREKKPDFADKIVVVEGDVSLLRLGLSDEHIDMITREVNIIFHMAATVRFDAHIKLATLTNVRGTREVIQLARECKQLKSLVHMSTAFSHATTSRVGTEVCEQFYPAPIEPHVMIDMVEHIAEDRLANMTPGLIKDWPNTYTFTKAIAEELVRTSTDGLPVCMIRPPTVLPTYCEPAPGWTDLSTVFGACGVLLGVGLGVVHVLLYKTETNMNMAPVEFVNNAAIVAATHCDTSNQHQRQHQRQHLPIYTVSSNSCPNFNFGHFTERLRSDELRRISTPLAVWYCGVIVTRDRLTYTLLTWVLHYIPAYIVDAVCKLLRVRIKQVPSLVYLYKKIYNTKMVLSPFLLNKWYFKDDNLVKMIDSMSDTDRLIYNCDVTTIDFDKYVGIYSMGLRKYILKDGLKDSDKAYRKQKILYYVNLVFTTLYVYVLWMIVYYLYKGVKYVVF